MDGISAAGEKGAIGIIGQAFNGCHIRHSSFTNMTSGIYEFGNDFENTFDDLYIIGSYIDFFIGGQSGLQFLTGGINLVGGLVGLRVQDSGIMAQQHLLATHPAGKFLLSGGATGPEGSIFILAILTLIAVIILFTLPRTNHGHSSTPSTLRNPIAA